MKHGHTKLNSVSAMMLKAFALNGCATLILMVVSINDIIINANLQHKPMNEEGVQELLRHLSVGWICGPLIIGILLYLIILLINVAARQHIAKLLDINFGVGDYWMATSVIFSISIVMVISVCGVIAISMAPRLPVIPDLLRLIAFVMGVASGMIVASSIAVLCSGPAPSCL